MTRCRLLYVALSLALTGIASTARAELKIGYIDSQKILDQYKPYQDALREYSRYEDELQREMSTMQNDLAKMQDTYERQSLLLSDKRKQEEQQAIIKNSRNCSGLCKTPPLRKAVSRARPRNCLNLLFKQ